MDGNGTGSYSFLILCLILVLFSFLISSNFPGMCSYSILSSQL